MKLPLKIVMIGSGNVAHHIMQSLKNNNHISFIQIFNHRKTNKLKALAKTNNCEFISDYSQLNTKADLYFICVKDDVISDVVKTLSSIKLKGLVVHTSGSTDLLALKNTSPNIGVYYPLQSFSYSDVINWKQTPILIEANTKKSEVILKSIAKSISGSVKLVNSSTRLQFHLAAVFACNFTNAMYVSAYELIENSLNKKDTELLLPIMQQSFQKLQNVHPAKAQTGPAMRNDKIVMKKHLQLLKQDKQLSHVYVALSDLIMRQQNQD